MRTFSYVIITILVVLIINSCTLQNEEEYFNAEVCDTTNVAYNDLTYIFTGICSQCHKTAFTERPGILMDSYENVKASINTGKVMPAIRHESGFDMPKGYSKLTDCEIQKITIWIENGMPEN